MSAEARPPRGKRAADWGQRRRRLLEAEAAAMQRRYLRGKGAGPRRVGIAMRTGRDPLADMRTLR